MTLRQQKIILFLLWVYFIPGLLFMFKITGTLFTVSYVLFTIPVMWFMFFVKDSDKKRVLSPKQAARISTKRRAELDALHYFRLADVGILQKNEKEVNNWLQPTDKSLSGPIDPDTWEQIDGRSFNADAEDLAETGIAGTLEHEKIFKKLGIKVNVEKDSIDDKKGTYTIKINRKKYVAYTQKDIDSYTFWTCASFCLQEIANDLLAEAGKKERLYLLYPGENYSMAVVLTPNELDLLTSWGKEVPYSEQRALEEFGRTSRQ